MNDFDVSQLADIPDPLGSSRPGAANASALAPKEESPTRSAMKRRRILAIGFAVAWMVGLLLVMGVANERLASPLPIVGCVLPAGLGLAALGLALSRGKAGLGPSVKSAGVLLGVATVLFGATCIVTSSSVLGNGALAKESFVCGELILVLGAVPLLAIALAMRNSTPNRSVTRSALLGASAGLVAAGVQAVHCPKDELVHLAIGHGLPIVVLALVGATVVRRLTAV